MFLLDSSVTALTIWGYQMSWLELVGTILNITTVYLLTKRKIINWPIGIVASVLFALLFFQFRLYADFIENIYYILTGFWGWWLWKNRGSNKERVDEVAVRHATKRENTIAIAVTVLGTLALGYVIAHLNIWLPKYFPEPAVLPYIDTLTTVMSFTAQILLTKRIVANWYYWIIVDMIAVWLYWYKGLKLVSVLFAIFLMLATKGLIDWRRQYTKQQSK